MKLLQTDNLGGVPAENGNWRLHHTARLFCNQGADGRDTESRREREPDSEAGQFHRERLSRGLGRNKGGIGEDMAVTKIHRNKKYSKL